MTYTNLGIQRPSLFCEKKRGMYCSAPSSRSRRDSRCDSSTAVLASVARSMSFATMAAVSLDHRLRSGGVDVSAGTGLFHVYAPAGLIWLLLFLWCNPLWRNLLPILRHIKQYTLVAL